MKLLLYFTVTQGVQTSTAAKAEWEKWHSTSRAEAHYSKRTF